MQHTLLSHAVSAARHARRTAGRLRHRWERVDTLPVLAARPRPRPLLRPRHLSVLGGRTLNVAVPFPQRAGGVHSAVLELTHGDRCESTPMTPEPQPDGTLLLTATVPLHYAPPGTGPAPRLTRGLWRLSVTVTDLAGRRIRADLRGVPPRAVEGPTLAHPPHPVSGALFRPVRSADRYALLKVVPPAPQAELAGVDLRWDRVTVHGRLLGPLPRHTSWAAEAVRRGAGGGTLRAAPAVTGPEFAFDLPLDRMTADGHTQHTWEVQLRSGRTRLKVGRRLSGVRLPQKVFRTPYRSVALADGRLLRVHVRLTATGLLLVSCAAYADPLPAEATTTVPHSPGTTDDAEGGRS